MLKFDLQLSKSGITYYLLHHAEL